MIGDVDLDDFFPDEQLDSTMVGKSQNQMSRITFDKSKEYANKKYAQNKEGIHSGKLNYMFLEISKEVRRRIQPIGKWGGGLGLLKCGIVVGFCVDGTYEFISVFFSTLGT